ncbi:uncharacterized protein LOC109949582 [Prunus persica]|uniref:uncharacterized protein LOC109949582 n=1 Tax=Prunus persica TaxID=3760 RepID=UPI0009AB9971|nr:uncharacterized protein LOC109949582 [Prunus persica]
MHTPTEPHFAVVKRVLRYLAGTLTHGIHFTFGDVHLQAYSDANWAGDVNDRRSMTEYVIFLGNNPISWCAKKQSTVSRSSTEAEYQALVFIAAEMSWASTTSLCSPFCFLIDPLFFGVITFQLLLLLVTLSFMHP